jgi:hypothetical protein
MTFLTGFITLESYFQAKTRFSRLGFVLSPVPQAAYSSRMAMVGFPDGTRIRASSISDRCVDDPERTFGLYLDARWDPTWPAIVVAWEDFRLPENPELAATQIAGAFGRAQRGELVEVGCLGGSGRTGTVLACMAVLAGVPAAEAVSWVRAAYRPGAVETAAQEAWVQWFAEWAQANPHPPPASHSRR